MIQNKKVMQLIWHDQRLCTWQDPKVIQFVIYNILFPSHSVCNLSISSYGDCITVLIYMNIELNVILTFFQGLAVSFALFVFCMDTDFSALVYQTGLFFYYFIYSLNEHIGQFYLHLTCTSSGVATLQHCKHMHTNIFSSF